MFNNIVVVKDLFKLFMYSLVPLFTNKTLINLVFVQSNYYFIGFLNLQQTRFVDENFTSLPLYLYACTKSSSIIDGLVSPYL